MRVRKILEQHGWAAMHGPYYTDFHERKPRELDVSAARVWTSKHDGIRAHVTLLIECKSFKKPAAQLLAQQRNVRTPDRLYNHWFGFDDPHLRHAVREILESAHLDAAEIVESTFYPRGEALVTPLLVDAPKPPCRASGTREPDDDSGAAWDATQQVFAALNGTIEDIATGELEELRDGLEHADDEAFNFAADVLRMIASDLFMFHPIVCIDAPLRLVAESGKMTPVPWCRIERARVYGVERQWIDVVSADAFEEYAATITAWYDRVLGRNSAGGR